MRLFNHKMRSFFIVAALFFALFDVATAFAKENTEEPWWQSERIVATGHGFPADYAENPGQAKILAKQAAMLDAYKNLAELASGIRITADETVTKGEVEAVIVGAKTESETYDEYGNCTVKVSVPLYGIGNSFTDIVFPRLPKENFPSPPLTSGEKNESKTTENYTGLIIDCSDITAGKEKAVLLPVLSPTIKDENNRIIYSAPKLERHTVIKTGMVGYVEKNNLNPVARAGNNPLVIKAVGLSKNSNPIISEADADMILYANSKAHFLDNCKVIFVGHKVSSIMQLGANRNVNSGATSDDDGYV